ncbi:unnamed protein product, partial [Ceratitis capitata]
MWNQYEAALQGSHKTNNVSEGRHNRFALLFGKHHPDLYSLLREFQKEQADTEVSIAEISLGKSVKAAPKRKWITIQKRLQGIVANYEHYRRNQDILTYLR